MKTNKLLSAALAMAALASTAFGARFYAQPSFAYAEMPNYFKSATGPSLALGVTFAEKHSVEIEGSRFDTEGDFDPEYKLRVAPVTVNYRYEFPISGKLSGSAGISLGFIRQELDVTFYDPFYLYYGGSASYHYEAKDEAFAAGFHAGVSYRMNDHFAITLGAKTLTAGESDVQQRNTTILVQLGLNCRL